MCGCCCCLIILVAFSFFFFFVSLILYFLKSNLYSRFLIFAFWYLLSIFYFSKPNLQYPSLPESEITGLTTLFLFGLFFFSTRLSLSPPSPFSSQLNFVWISVCSRRWELVTGWICLSPFHFPILSSWSLLSTSSLSSSPYNSVNTSEWSRL